jgi:sugar/nucleoside kinase (ribokinase family)
MAVPRYVVVGHVTVDLLPDGGRRLGGTASYAAVQAARLGLEVVVVTAGARAELEPLLNALGPRVDVRLQERAETTTFVNTGVGLEREQRVLAWAGPIDLDDVPDGAILHAAAVAREVDVRQLSARADLRVVTPQGTLRRWDEDGRVRLTHDPTWSATPAGWDAALLSTHERAYTEAGVDAVLAAGGVVITTAADQPAILEVGGARTLVPPPAIDVVDDVGAGDVLAAAYAVRAHEGHDPLEALRWAQVAAGLHISREGLDGVPSRAEIDAVLG